MANLSYHEQETIENTKKLRKLIGELPHFCADFFRGIEPRTSSRTRIAYAYDLSIFLTFSARQIPFGKIGISATLQWTYWIRLASWI